MKIFLSHSSRDKGFVRRLNKDLKSHGFCTWCDEEDIPLGGPITASIQYGITSSDVVLVFLSRESVLSKWVSTEWQSRFFQNIKDDRKTLIPVLINDCEIPVFLADRRYADFRDAGDYENSLSTLLRFLTIIQSQTSQATPAARTVTSILEYTKDILDDLESEYIALPINKRMMLIDTIKRIPRSGKKVRLNSFRHRVRIRTVYDHVISVAHVADCLLPHINHGIRAQEFGDLAMCIAYHELNEIVLGDIPTFTSLSARSRANARIYAEERLRSITPAEREQIASKFIWMFVGEKHRKSLDAVNEIFSDVQSRLYVTFKTLDKIDPIIATWRYLHTYRGKLGDTPREFNKKMKDFYINPDIKAYIRTNAVDERLDHLVINLQERSNAWDYYEDPSRIFGDPNFFELPVDVVRRAIEGVALFHDRADPPHVNRED